MTKTRLQFLIALLLVVLPFLGFPSIIDMVIVSVSGISIASMTFFTARERRLQKKLSVSIDPIKKSTVLKKKRKAVITPVHQDRELEEESSDTESHQHDNDIGFSESEKEEDVSVRKSTRKRSVASSVITGTGVIS